MMQASTRQLINILPYSVRDKVYNYMEFIDDRVTDIALESGRVDRVDEVRGELETIFLLRNLHTVYATGLQNYQRMIENLESWGVDGFRIGSSHYGREAMITPAWLGLVDDLLRLVHSLHLDEYVLSQTSVDDLVRRYLDEHPGILGNENAAH